MMPSDVRYGEILALFRQNGWWLLRVPGSHHVFTDGSRIYSLPVHHGKVKHVYYKQIQKIFPEAG